MAISSVRAQPFSRTYIVDPRPMVKLTAESGDLLSHASSFHSTEQTQTMNTMLQSINDDIRPDRDIPFNSSHENRRPEELASSERQRRESSGPTFTNRLQARSPANPFTHSKGTNNAQYFRKEIHACLQKRKSFRQRFLREHFDRSTAGKQYLD